MSIIFILLTCGGIFKYFSWAKKQPSIMREVAFGGGGVLTLFCLFKLPKFLKWYRKQNIFIKAIVIALGCGFGYLVYYIKVTFDLDYSLLGTLVLGSLILLSRLKPKKIKKKAKKAYENAKVDIGNMDIKSKVQGVVGSERVVQARSKLSSSLKSERVVQARSKVNSSVKPGGVSSKKSVFRNMVDNLK